MTGAEAGEVRTPPDNQAYSSTAKAAYIVTVSTLLMALLFVGSQPRWSVTLHGPAFSSAEPKAGPCSPTEAALLVTSSCEDLAAVALES
jgi:hypothetical protein